MHLASLCGTPHVVWTNRKIYRMGKSSRQKYESWWNPLGTPVAILDHAGFSPTLKAVMSAARDMLDAQADRGDSSATPPSQA